MVGPRVCKTIKDTGEACCQPPLREGEHCFWHEPENAEAAMEARRLGGKRRKREGSLAGAYQFDGIRSMDDLRRILEIAAYDALALENSMARSRVLIALVQAGTRLFEVSEFEERLSSVEDVLGPRPLPAGSR